VFLTRQGVKAALGTSPWWEMSGVFRQGGCAVLTYHRVGANRYGFKHLSADVFRRQMQWLRAHATIVAPSDFRAACASRRRARPAVLVTFDDGYRDYHDVAYPILREVGIPAVNFVATGFADEPERMFWWDEVDLAVWGTARTRVELPWQPGQRLELDRAHREQLRMAVRRHIWSRPEVERDSIIDALCDALEIRRATLRIDRQVMNWDEIRAVSELTAIGGHTRNHQLMSKMDEPGLRAEVRACRDRIAVHLHRPTMFAYPSGAFSETAKRIVLEEGFQTAFSAMRGFNDAATDPMAARRIGAPADAGQLGYLLSGIPERLPRRLRAHG
jgi:peptidoglycan/xylan/chitin deacetylase (PgdA/CDA1 family)